MSRAAVPRPGALAGLRLALGALLFLLLPDLALARQLTDAERSDLRGAVARFDAAMRAKKMDEVTGVLPPRFVAYLAKQGKLDVEVLRKEIAEQATEAFKQIQVDSFGMDVDKAEFRELPDGTPYVLIPTDMTMTVGPRKIQSSSKTLALLDDGSWYLVDLGDAGRVTLFTTVYPAFSGVEFGGATIKTVP